jgi:hypothetical protein
MNKEQQEIIGEVYKNYTKWWEESDDSCNLTEEQNNKWLKLIDGGLQWAPFSEEEFNEKVIINPDFAKQWGVTIYTVIGDGDVCRIGVNYNDKTIESYE